MLVTSVSLGFVYEKSGRSEKQSLIPKRLNCQICFGSHSHNRISS